MAFLEWNDTYSVDVMAMDEQHKKLVGLINQLHDAMKAGKGSTEIFVILNGLVDYTKYHFEAEEKILRENNYPGLLVQENKHKNFIVKVQEFQSNAETKKLTISLEVQNFLKDWLIEHISGEDKKYGKYLNTKGIH
jgi:hemerythrin